MWGLVGKIYLIIVLLFVLSCAPLSREYVNNCEQSGGDYTSGFSETKGQYYFCECPDGKYESGGICHDIAAQQVELCEKVSNKFVNCAVDGSECICTFIDSGTVSFLPIGVLETSNCECFDGGCGCGPNLN
ncbi:hypothetical protein J4464_06870 [Candidatus Woesearchaeota archaeon]|nr:hypothetical protein [Candidatus Woesearchaeota archaeon]